MNTPSNIFGSSPRDPLQTGGKNAPDPDKFKKVLGVEKHQETDERGKRPRAQQTEEDEADDDAPVQKNPSLFDYFMADAAPKEVSDTPSRQTTQRVSDDLPLEDFDRTFVSYDKTPPPENEDSIRIEGTPQDKVARKTGRVPTDAKKQKTEMDAEVAGVLLPPVAEKEIPTSVNTTSKKTSSKKAAPHKNTTAPTHTSSHKSTKKAEEQNLHLWKEEESLLPTTTPTKEIAEKLPQELAVSSPNPTPTVVENVAPAAPAASAAPYAQFSPQVFELFQKMVGIMMVMQFQGKTTTSFVLNVPSSPLNGARVEIEHYDTAPHAFNIRFSGSPEAQTFLLATTPDLEKELKLQLPQFDIRVRAPLLAEESKEEKKQRVTRVQNKKAT